MSKRVPVGNSNALMVAEEHQAARFNSTQSTSNSRLHKYLTTVNLSLSSECSARGRQEVELVNSVEKKAKIALLDGI